MATGHTRFPISLKLSLLAGIPVVGALLLSFMLIQAAQRASRSAASLGTVEDLARLTSHISGVIHTLQAERAATALALANAQTQADAIAAPRAQVDARLSELEAFMSARDAASLPRRLARDLGGARRALTQLGTIRQSVDSKQAKIVETLNYFGQIDQELISATAGLTQLSDDGELLRTITLLVSTLEVKERASQQHAVLANVFAAGEFPPGLFRSLVTLVTEEEIYTRVLRAYANDEQMRLFDRAGTDPSISEASSMRAKALEVMDGESWGVSATDWYAKQNVRIERLRALDQDLNSQVKRVALAKVAEARRSVRTSLGVSAAVLLVSLLIAAMIGRSVRRGVASLTLAATEVRERKDFSVRAKRVSSDEVADLADVFNEMVAGIQERDVAIADHQKNLEQLVQRRTQELAQRNTEMRVVLDTVEQGLVTLDMDGQPGVERSAAFKRWFPDQSGGQRFEDLLAPQDETARQWLRLGWESIVEDVLPLELALEQMPKRLERDSLQFALSYRPIFQEDKLASVLLIVTDITAELSRIRREAEQREFLAVFERVTKDKCGFIEFFNEASAMTDELATNPPQDDVLLLRRVHTLKGNAGMFGLGSVAELCHSLETRAAEAGIAAMREALPSLVNEWATFARRVVPLIGIEADDIVEIEYEELEDIAEKARNKRPHVELVAAIERLRYEPVRQRLRRLAEQAQALARRLGRGELEVTTEANGVRLPAARFADFWSNFIHVIRNAVDHGIEPTAERLALGKPERGHLTITTVERDGKLQLDIKDDGRGIDWQKIRAKAQSLGLPHDSDADLARALFADGVTTASIATQTSGRGVGMGAVHLACAALGGELRISSKLGAGTRFTFILPVFGPQGDVTNRAEAGIRPSLRAPISLRPFSTPPA
jgi:two-component system chemotaxis sensor kinase CheA